MELAHSILSHLSAAVFVVLCAMAVRQWYLRRGEASTWLVLTFGNLAFITTVGLITPDVPTNLAWKIVNLTILALIALLPWFLYRFATSFREHSKLRDSIYDIITVVTVIALLTLPVSAGDDASPPGWFVFLLLGVVAQWLLLLGTAAYTLWTAGRSQPTVAQRRMQLLAAGSAGMALALVLSAFIPDEAKGVAGLLSDLVLVASAISFFAGFVAPRTLRVIWRQNEHGRMRAGITELLTVNTVEHLQELLLPQMASLVAARSIVFMDRDGRVVAQYGEGHLDAMVESERFSDPDIRARKRAMLAAGQVHSATPILPMDFPFGTLLIGVNPYMPYFGDDEFALMESLGVVFSLVLERIEALEVERERAKSLAELSEIKDEFVAMASHELRTPLTSILGFTQTVRTRGENLAPDQRDQFLQIVEEQALRLTRLVEDMLTLTRIESGSLKVNVEDVKVCQAARAAFEALEMPDGAVDCSNELTVRADPHHLHQILVNYLTNAQRYGAAPYMISAKAVDGGEAVRIMIEDRGEGVPAEFAPRLFERFAQAPQGGGATVGTGLGLSIIKQMAIAQGGEAWYEPREGGGSCFGVTLPA